MTYRIIERKDVNLEELMRLLKQTFWACNRSAEDVQTTIDKSICFCAYDENDRMMRSVTDYHSSALYETTQIITRNNGPIRK